jgi:hypothetical protein
MNRKSSMLSLQKIRKRGSGIREIQDDCHLQEGHLDHGPELRVDSVRPLWLLQCGVTPRWLGSMGQAAG